MKLLAAILWFQLLVGVVGMVLFFSALHTGALGVEWSARLRTEYQQNRNKPDFREPAQIKSMSYERILDSYHGASRARAHNAGYGFLLSAYLAIVGALTLWLLSRHSKYAQVAATPASCSGSLANR
jgi:hypothetical protein